MLKTLGPKLATLLFAALMGGIVAAQASDSALHEFADTRFIAPLPGSLFGVTPDGRAGFDGAMNITVPTAYTPGPGSLVVGSLNEGSNRENKLPDQFDGGNVNGSFIPGGLGMSVEGHHVFACDMWTSKHIESLIGLQVELFPQTENRPSFAVGCSDLFDMRGPASNPHSARSVYAVATMEFPKAGIPTYLTLGYGNRRYQDRPIGALSIQPWSNIKFSAEYDGFGTNLAAAYRLWHSDAGWNAILYGQYQKMDFPGIGFSITRSQ
jgi:hypothetical protein